ncbi:SufE protein [Pseudoalteromonas porphyrae]|uniref:SufE protein n=2 Tax=Pseudoalteromonas TaxID=53246 RepID=A0A0N0M1S5_9GAMM|nr:MULTISPECIES: SufE family protein [Pseudoalteromonas]KPH64969.1 SufE protein [Pseudoalteromonas porphyrae]KPH95061.1 SufE protein [Pseudoalteromonas porphyrae]NMR25922.1 SufE family protein [Pseudoalteromonas sp. NEC-BIFX-2020_015]NNG43784.1 SufE family protein [Pseudoalteromonas sp. NEC-BIFX-2020_002]
MNKTFKEIAQTLKNAPGWQQKYREIMLLGKLLPSMPDILKTHDALVPGCESKVWLYLDFDLEESCIVLVGDSDTRIVKGLLALILSLYNGLTPTQILSINAFEEFEKLGLISHLSPSRGNGVKAIVERIQTMAAQK